MALNLSEILK